MESNDVESVASDADASTAQSLADAEDRATKRRSLQQIPIWFLSAGFVTGFWGEGDLFDVLAQVVSTVAFYVLLHRWCGADARLHRRDLWRYFVLTLVICPGPLLVVPIHLVRTRGVRGLLFSLLALIYLVAAIAVQVIGILAGDLLSQAL
jgi:hypothetical protein